MAYEKEIHRGEVWEVLSSEAAFGSVEGYKRPCLIVTSEKGCQTSPVINVVPLTTKEKYGYMNVRIENPRLNRTNWAMCNQITAVSRSQLAVRWCKLETKEMERVDEAVLTVLGVCTENNDDDKIKNLEAEIMAQKVEIALYQKLYEKAVDQLATMKLSFDIERRGASEAVAKQPEPPVVPEEPGLIDINRCDIAALKSIGASEAVAKLIISGRPYMDVSDLMLVHGITRAWYNLVSKKVTVGDTGEYKRDKFDINECSFGELTSLGLSDNTVMTIINGRPFGNVEETETLPGMTEAIYKKLVRYTTVTGTTVAEKAPEPKKVNINTASAAEICVATGLSRTVCFSITGTRKRNGLYRSVNDLLNVPRFTQYHLDKFGSMMEV